MSVCPAETSSALWATADDEEARIDEEKERTIAFS
jgi:hypothetical protein